MRGLVNGPKGSSSSSKVVCDPPGGPFLDRDLAVLLIFVNRMGTAASMEVCAKRWHRSRSLEDMLKPFSPEKVQVLRSRGTLMLFIVDPDWVVAWARYHGIRSLHHAQRFRLDEGRF